MLEVRVARRAIGGVIRRRRARGPSRPRRNPPPPSSNPATLLPPVTDRRKYPHPDGPIVAALIGAVLLAVRARRSTRSRPSASTCRAVSRSCCRRRRRRATSCTPDDIDRSISIMQNRINKLGVSEPEIRKQGTDQIVIQLAGVHDPAKAAALIGKTAQLMLFDFENDLDRPVDRRARQPGRDTVALRPADAGAGAGGEGHAGGVLPLRRTKTSRRRSAGRQEDGVRSRRRRVKHSLVAGRDTMTALLKHARRQGAAEDGGAEGPGAHDRRQLQLRRPAVSARSGRHDAGPTTT